jgi:hypothetical protein
MTGGVMVEHEALIFVEDAEAQIIFVSTPKRKQKIKIFVPVGNFARWFITYEDGKHIPGLSNGSYLSRKVAIRAVIQWEMDAKKTQEAKQYELFGDKIPPVLKRKKARNGPRA